MVGLVDLAAVGRQGGERALPLTGAGQPDSPRFLGKAASSDEMELGSNARRGDWENPSILAVNSSRTLALKTCGVGGREEGRQRGWEGRNRHVHLLFESWKFVPSL